MEPASSRRLLSTSGGELDLFCIELGDGTFRLLFRLGHGFRFAGGHHKLHGTQTVNGKLPFQAELGQWVPGLLDVVSKYAVMNTHANPPIASVAQTKDAGAGL